MAKQKNTGKTNTVEIVPTREQLMAMVSFLKEKVQPDGTAHFTHNDAMQNKEILEKLHSRTYVGGILSFLTNEGVIEKLQTGRRYNPTIWKVDALLDNPDGVRTREEVGKFRLVGRKPPEKQLQVDVVKKDADLFTAQETQRTSPPIEELLHDEQAESNNEQTLNQLKDAIVQMTAHLQSLPNEMGSHLSSLSDKLEATTDTKALEDLQAKVKQVEQERDDLRDELSTARGLISTLEQNAVSNTHQIYRKGSSILEMVDRMIKVPAWTLKQNGPTMRDEIRSDIEYILKQVGFEEEQTKEEQTTK